MFSLKDLILFLALVIFSCSCRVYKTEFDAAKIPVGYPPTLKFSQKRYDTLLVNWKKFCETYNIRVTIPLVDPVVLTVYDIPKHFKPPLSLLNSHSDSVSIYEAKDSLLAFIDRWHNLFNVRGNELEVFSSRYERNERLYRFQFTRRFPEPYDVHRQYGRSVTASVSVKGELNFIRSECIPLLPTPQLPNIGSRTAKQVLHGKTIHYFDGIENHKNTLSSTRLSEPKLVKLLIPFIRNSSLDSVEYRLTWKFDLFPEYVYVDAITGKEINYSYQYVRF